MSQAIVCPHCKGKLRVRASSGPRVRCHLCHKGFPNPAAPAIPVELYFRPLVPTPEPQADLASVEVLDVPVPETVIEELPVEPEAPSVAVAEARFAPDAMLSRTKRPTSKRAKAARERLRARRAAKVRARDYGIAGFILFVIIGLIAVGGYMVLKDDGVASRPTEDETPADVVEEPHPPPLSSALVDSANRPKPSRLLGVWELRTDDERNGSMEFRA